MTGEIVEVIPREQNACRACHTQEFKDWSSSHHHAAMQPANAETVLGDFNDTSFTEDGVTSTFFKKDGRFFVKTDGPGGQLAEFEIRYTFGFKPLQQYRIELPGGRLRALGIAWDSRPKGEGGERWYHLYTDLTGEHLERQRVWDSCFTLDFSYIHGGSVRPSARARYRQWLTHKLSTWWDQFGTLGCVGCGRCIAWCPAGIDLTEEVRAIRASYRRRTLGDAHGITRAATR